VNLSDLCARARAIRAARGNATTDPGQEFDAGVVLAFALFLRREDERHAGDRRDIRRDLADLCTAIPWLGPALDGAEPLEHVEAG
jgi:hypothetical protein